MNEKYLEVAYRIANRYATLDTVQAVAIAGSLQNGTASENSDMDMYIYTERELTLEERHHIAYVDSEAYHQNDYWGAGDVWMDTVSGIEIDAVYWTVDNITRSIESNLKHHTGWMGYTTAFWHTVKISYPVYDRTGWFAQFQMDANVPYPEPLRQNIIKANYPLLRDAPHAYSKQIEKAIQRKDWVSVTHRLAEFFASYFDILFALNRATHPGEKRLIHFASQLDTLPEHFESDMTRIFAQSAPKSESLMPAIHTLTDNLDVCLLEHEIGVL